MNTRTRMWMWRGGMAASLLAMTSSAALAGGPAERAKASYDRGVANMKAQQYRDAFYDFEGAVGLEDTPMYRVSFCEAAVAMKSLHHAEQACRGLPGDASSSAYEKRAVAAVQGMTRLKADAFAKRARTTDLRNQAELWGKAIALYPAPEYYAGLCVTYQSLGQTADAVASCNQAAALTKGTKDASKYEAAAKKLSSAAASQPTAAQQEMLDKLARSLVTPRLQTEGYIEKRYLEQYTAQAKGCVDAVNAAKKAGARPEHMVRTDFALPGSELRTPPTGGASIEWAPLSSVEELCLAKFGALTAKDAVDKLAAAQRKIDLIAKGGELEESDIALMTGPANDCSAAVTRALGELKVPGATVLKVSDKVTVTLATAKAEVCDKLVSETVRVKAAWQARIEAARLAKLEPFKAVMKGDKARIIEEEEFFEFSGWTKGGAEMTEPGEFKKASVWFKVLSRDTDDGRYTIWTLRRYEFKGDKLKKTTEKTVKTRQGVDPPAKSYR